MAPELWFSPNNGDLNRAKGLCQTECPFTDRCYAQAFEDKERHGVWGGVNFETLNLDKPKVVPTRCKKDLHDLPLTRENNTCKECAKETTKTWVEKQIKERSPWYLNKLKKQKEQKRSKRASTRVG